MLPILIIAVFLVLVIVGGIHAHRQELKRQQELAAFAAELGWSFTKEKDRSLCSRFPKLTAFSRGSSRYAHNTLRGPVSVPLLNEGAPGQTHQLHGQAGDYHFTRSSGSGKNRSTKTYRFSYLMITIPAATGHNLLIRTENLGDKMKAAMGFDDIDFESVEFSDRFYVDSRDKRFAYDVVHPRMIEFLMNGPTPDIEIDHGVLCLFDPRSRWQPADFRRRMAWAGEFLRLWPRHLVTP